MIQAIVKVSVLKELKKIGIVWVCGQTNVGKQNYQKWLLCEEYALPTRDVFSEPKKSTRCEPQVVLIDENEAFGRLSTVLKSQEKDEVSKLS